MKAYRATRELSTPENPSERTIAGILRHSQGTHVAKASLFDDRGISETMATNIQLNKVKSVYETIDATGAMQGSALGKVVLITGAGRGTFTSSLNIFPDNEMANCGQLVFLI